MGFSKYPSTKRSSSLNRFDLALTLILTFLSTKTWADSPFQVIPWNGYKAALSLTFDDGDPIHLSVAIPELDKRGLKGTFFLIAGKLDQQAEWKKASLEGHEIGNHSWDHKHLSEYGPGDFQKEVTDSRKLLEKLTGKPVITYAYPFFETSPELETVVDQNAFIARGGYGTFVMKPDNDVDWDFIPCRTAMTTVELATYQQWIDLDLAQGGWSVFLIHGIEGTPWGYSPILKKTYTGILDYLVSKRKDIWIAPFGQVGAYWKAQKILEAVKPEQRGTAIEWAWKKPVIFPNGVVLKMKIEGTSIVVSQEGKPLTPSLDGSYPVSFDSGELTVKNAPWKLSDLTADLPPSPALNSP